MAAPTLKAALWRARLALERLGAAGALALGLLALGAAYGAFALVPAASARDALAQEVAALEARAQARGRARLTLKSEDRLQDFYAHFPSLATAGDWLEQIYGVAEERGLALTSGEYRLADDRNSRLARYEVTLPVNGSYSQVRGFLARVLETVPPAALEEVTFRRAAPDERTLEVRVKLTLYLERRE